MYAQVRRLLTIGERPQDGGEGCLIGGVNQRWAPPIGGGNIQLEFLTSGGNFVLSFVITIHDYIKNKVTK